ncbi:MAG TPA: AraC family transcriptional regulator [Alphaproteobacteria bacterium]|nr:AraC family transcriptional regulator [Alphaproteobacteria bacterium]
MNKPSTVLDYSRRIERAVAYMAAHLDAPPNLEAVAGVACFSPCHFHRIYRYLVGETVADTMRRLLLHRAAGDLVQGSAPVAAIARRAGYGSVAAFSRAFRTAYGVPPAAYRRRGGLVAPASQPDQEESAMYDVEIRTMPPLRLAAMRHVGPYMQIGASFDRLFAWAAGRGLMGPSARSFGIYYDDPDSVPVADLRSEAAMVVGSEVEADGDVHIVTLAGGRHAAIRHKGPYAELEAAYRWLYRDWLPGSGDEAADRPCFEEYLNNPRALPPQEWLTEICLPLAER